METDAKGERKGFWGVKRQDTAGKHGTSKGSSTAAKQEIIKQHWRVRGPQLYTSRIPEAVDFNHSVLSSKVKCALAQGSVNNVGLTKDVSEVDFLPSCILLKDS